MPVSHNFFRVPQRCQTAWMAPSPGDPLGAEGGTFWGLAGSVGTLAPFFLVPVSSGTMPVSQKKFQTPPGVKLLGWREPRDPLGAEGGTVFGLWGTLAPFFLVQVSDKFFRKKYCHQQVSNCLGGANPWGPGGGGDLGRAESATFWGAA